jgi:hypothetical protein
MDEAVLRRPVGGAEVMHAQYRHLIEIAGLPHVTLQVIPFSRGAHAGESGSFTVLRFEERDLPDIVYLEQLTKPSTWTSARTSSATWRSLTRSAARP